MKGVMMSWWVPIVAVAAGTGLRPDAVRAETVADFEGLTFQAAMEYENGSGLSGGGFESSGLWWNNAFTDWGEGVTSWDGWAYSKATDMTTPGFGNQYSAYSQSYLGGTSGPGAGADGSNVYAVASMSEYGVLFGDPPPTIRIPAGKYVRSAKIANTTYAYLAMKDGDDGNDPPFVSGPFGTGDFFKLTITGKDAQGDPVGAISYYLADFRPAGQRGDSGIKTDYILSDWTDLNALEPLGAWGGPVSIADLAGARALEFRLDTSDRLPPEDGGWANTPLYFAMDDIILSAVAEPSAIAMIVSGALCCLLGWRRRRTWIQR